MAVSRKAGYGSWTWVFVVGKTPAKVLRELVEEIPDDAEKVEVYNNHGTDDPENPVSYKVRYI